MERVVIYHSADLDGWMSAAIVKYFWKNTCNWAGDTLNFIGYNYGDAIPDLSKYDKVIMCDISFPVEKMYEIYDKLLWIDHHISAIKSVDYTTKGLRDTNFSACELTWKYFFPNEIMPEIIRLLGLYDSFRHKDTDEEFKVLEFQYGARAFIKNYEDAYAMLIEELIETTSSIVDRLHLQGLSIYKYLCTEAKQIYKNGFTINFLEYKEDIKVDPWNSKKGTNVVRKFICINRERFNPINFGINYHDEGYDGCSCFCYANGKWNFSLYNDNEEVDCSVIAKQYGGGGHKGASGFVCDNETFLNIINNEINKA